MNALLPAYLILYQSVTRGAFLAAGPGPIVEIVLLAAVTAISHEAFPAFTAAVIFALERERPLRVTVTGCGMEGKEDMVRKTRMNSLLTQTVSIS